MDTAAQSGPRDTQINWLELARFAAEGQGHADLGRGVRRLATLAAAVHRQRVAQTLASAGAATPASGTVHGRAAGENLQARPGTEARS